MFLKSYKKNHFLYLFLFLGVIFFGLWNYLVWSGFRQYNSPDETANAVFLDNFAKRGSLAISAGDEYGELQEFIHPRSAYAQNSKILPVGFWGLPLFYGLVAKVLPLPYTAVSTSLLMLGALWSLYYFFGLFYKKKVAMILFIIGFLTPAFWYYTSRGLFPNVSFFSLLCIGSALLAASVRLEKSLGVNTAVWVKDALGILFIGAGLLMRPNEAVWFVPTFCLLLLFYKGWSWRRFLVFGVAGILFLLLFLSVNRQLYSDLVGAYVASNSLPVTGFLTYIWPFGFHPRVVVFAVGHIWFGLSWWLTVPALMGLGFFVFDKIKKRSNADVYPVAVATVMVSGYLFVSYGSLPTSVQTIGAAQVRYWLPLYALALFWVGYLIHKLLSLEKNDKLKVVVVGIYILLSGILGFRSVYFGNDGLLATAANIKHGQNLRQSILTTTPQDAIIVSDTEDKMIWPERAVMVKFFNPRIRSAMGEFLARGREVYYLTPDLDAVTLERVQRYLGEGGLELGSIALESEPHIMYQIRKIKK